MDYLIGLDAGTTSVKAGLFAPGQPMLAVAREEYQLDTPSPERAQLDPQIYWRACVRTVRRVISAAGIDPKEVRAVGVCSQGETTIPMGADGHALHPAIVWLDNRAAEQAARLAGQFSAVVYDRTGVTEFLPTWSACKMLWLSDNEPEVFKRVWKYMLVQDYLVYRMTGRAVTDGSIACTTLLYDIRQHTWWPEMMDAVGLDASRLPEILAPGSRVGPLSAQAADELGLPRQVVVVNAGMDQCTGAVGSGNIAPGIISESTGAVMAIQATILDPGLDRSRIVPVYYHSVPGKYLFVPFCPTGGMALKWLRDSFFQTEIEQAAGAGTDAYDLLTALAARVPPGSDGLVMLPHLMGAFTPVPNNAARGSFTGFTLSHRREHFVRAVLEGVAYQLRQNLDPIQQAGISVSEIRSTGGGARSGLWNQIKADVCQLPVVTLQNEDTSLIGNAILAGVALGVFGSIEEGCEALVIPRERILPGEQAEAYSAAYRRYVDLDASLLGYFRRSYGKESN